ncbi:hypothetical protein AAT19DRAFT_10879, partial [Rhodotorula toruloides]
PFRLLVSPLLFYSDTTPPDRAFLAPCQTLRQPPPRPRPLLRRTRGTNALPFLDHARSFPSSPSSSRPGQTRSHPPPRHPCRHARRPRSSLGPFDAQANPAALPPAPTPTSAATTHPFPSSTLAENVPVGGSGRVAQTPSERG